MSTVVEDDRVALRVRDDGVGMSQDKIAQLLADRQTLDGEVRSLGFVFVRQTVAEFGGELAIRSAPISPPAPAMFIITTGCFMLSDIFWPARRTITSVALPDCCGSTIRIDLAG